MLLAFLIFLFLISDDNGHHNQDLNRNYNNKMNDLSPSETPKVIFLKSNY